MKAIVAVDLNWGIGYKGSLLQRIPDDMKNFKRMTTGKVVVMGQATFKSLPGQEPLKDRVNIVLSDDESFRNEKVTICRSLEDLFNVLMKFSEDDVFIIGGESVYKQLLGHCSEVYVTKITRTYTADKYFVNLDQSEQWYSTSTSEPYKYNDIEYRFVKYVKDGNQGLQEFSRTQTEGSL